jgi:hypothetical protein
MTTPVDHLLDVPPAGDRISLVVGPVDPEMRSLLVPLGRDREYREVVARSIGTVVFDPQDRVPPHRPPVPLRRRRDERARPSLRGMARLGGAARRYQRLHALRRACGPVRPKTGIAVLANYASVELASASSTTRGPWPARGLRRRTIASTLRRRTLRRWSSG